MIRLPETTSPGRQSGLVRHLHRARKPLPLPQIRKYHNMLSRGRALYMGVSSLFPVFSRACSPIPCLLIRRPVPEHSIDANSFNDSGSFLTVISLSAFYDRSVFFNINWRTHPCTPLPLRSMSGFTGLRSCSIHPFCSGTLRAHPIPCAGRSRPCAGNELQTSFSWNQNFIMGDWKWRISPIAGDREGVLILYPIRT